MGVKVKGYTVLGCISLMSLGMTIRNMPLVAIGFVLAVLIGVTA